jgi:iron complex transport system substrate-binding protein
VRIASLLPAATEIVTALGLADRLVAVTFECPEAARARCPVVVDTAIPPGLDPAAIDAWVRDRTARDLPMYELDRAALAAAAPDLVLTQDLCRVCALPAGPVAEACRVIGIDAEVLSLDPHSLDDVLAATAAVGRAAGADAAADALLARLRARLAGVERAVAGRPRPRVLVLEWTDPPYLAGHWVPELVRRAGGAPVGAVDGGRSVAAEWADLPAAELAVVAPCGFGLDGALAQSPAVAARLPACRWSRSTRPATSCRPARAWSTGSRRWPGPCTRVRSRSRRPGGSPGCPPADRGRSQPGSGSSAVTASRCSRIISLVSARKRRIAASSVAV